MMQDASDMYYKYLKLADVEKKKKKAYANTMCGK